MAIIDPGLYPGIPAADYHSVAITPAPALSAGFAWTMMTSPHGPAAAWHGSGLNPAYQPEEKAAFDVGSALHLLFLEPDKFDAAVKIIGFDDWRTQASKDARDRAREAGRIPLLEKQGLMIQDMRAAMMNDLHGLPFDTAPRFAAEGFRGGEAESSLFWIDPEFQIWCKCRPDYVRSGVIRDKGREVDILIDYKSSALDDLDRVSEDRGWFARADFYMAGWRHQMQRECEYWYVVQSKTAPYFTRVVRMAEAAIYDGRDINRKAKALFAECLASGHWPSRCEQILTIERPSWAQKRHQDAADSGKFDVAPPSTEEQKRRQYRVVEAAYAP